MTPGDQQHDATGGGSRAPSDTDSEAPVGSQEVVARRVLVSGRVQGVFFRASTRNQARRRDVLGWVRNTPDGRVEAHLQGPAGPVDEVLGWMRAGGPSAARVTRVEVEEVEPITAQAFDVRRG